MKQIMHISIVILSPEKSSNMWSMVLLKTMMICEEIGSMVVKSRRITGDRWLNLGELLVINATRYIIMEKNSR